MNKAGSMISWGCSARSCRPVGGQPAGLPPCGQGMVRYVLQLPHQGDESAFQVELIAQTVAVDDAIAISSRQDRGRNDPRLGLLHAYVVSPL